MPVARLAPRFVARAKVSIERRVMPSRMSLVTGVVISVLLRTMNRLAPLASATLPSARSISASS